MVISISTVYISVYFYSHKRIEDEESYRLILNDFRVSFCFNRDLQYNDTTYNDTTCNDITYDDVTYDDTTNNDTTYNDTTYKDATYNL